MTTPQNSAAAGTPAIPQPPPRFPAPRCPTICHPPRRSPRRPPQTHSPLLPSPNRFTRTPRPKMRRLPSQASRRIRHAHRLQRSPRHPRLHPDRQRRQMERPSQTHHRRTPKHHALRSRIRRKIRPRNRNFQSQLSEIRNARNSKKNKQPTLTLIATFAAQKSIRHRQHQPVPQTPPPNPTEVRHERCQHLDPHQSPHTSWRCRAALQPASDRPEGRSSNDC